MNSLAIFSVKRVGVFLTMLFAVTLTFGQKEGNIWYFGSNAGLDFNTNPPTALTNSAMNGYEGCASIADTGGKILFYTDGTTIWNKRHDTMQNGTGLLGGVSSAQSAVIVPYPKKDSLYFVFTVPQNGTSNGFRYSIVNMNLDTGNGGVTSTKNILLYNDTREKLTAVKHANGRDYWVLIQEWKSNAYRAYQVTDTGVVLPPTRSVIGTSSDGWYMLKANPQGDKVATTHAISSPKVNVFDFNNSTGVLSNLIVLNIPGKCLELYGTEFSPNGRVLYAGVYNCSRVIYQWNLNAGNDTAINRSRVKLDSASTIDVGTFQLATNGKIYIARDQKTFLSVINYPNVLDTCCAFRENGISLSSKTGRFGLPTIIQSYFAPLNPHDFKFTYNNQCVGDTITATATGDSITSVKFLYGSQVDSGRSVKYVFSTKGVYEITMVTERFVPSSCSVKFMRDTIRHKISIGEPKRILPADTTFCDSFSFVLRLDSNLYTSHKWSIVGQISDTLLIEKSGKYSVNVVDTLNCAYSDSIAVKQYKFPEVTVMFDSVICNGNIWRLAYQSKDTTSNFLYYLRIFDSTYTFTDTFLSIHLQDTGIIDWTFIAVNDKRCYTLLPHTTFNVPLPIADFDLTEYRQCLRGNTFNITNTSNGYTYPLAYRWDFGNGDTSSVFEPDVIYHSHDTFAITLTVKNKFGCQNSYIDTAFVFANPIADFTVNDTLACFLFQNFSFQSNAFVAHGNISKYYWDLGDNQFDSSYQVSNISYAGVGEYSISHIAVSEQNCADTVYKRIHVKPHPTAKYWTNTLGQCLKANNFELLDTSTHSSKISKILWQIPSLSLVDSGRKVSDIVFSTDGIFAFKQIVYDEFGCTDTVVGAFTVYPQANLSFMGDTACLRDSIILQSKSDLSSGNFDSWEWDLGDSQRGHGEKYAHLYAHTGTYNIALTTVTDQNCKDTLVKNASVLIRPLPAPKIEAVSPLCENFMLKIANNTVDTGQHSGMDYYLDWYGTQQVVNDKSFERLPLDTGVQQMNFFAINQFGCRDSTFLEFRVVPEPKADFFFPFRLQCLHGNIFEPKNLSVGFTYSLTYHWDFGGSNTFTVFEPVISFPDTGIYPMYLTVENNFGCVSSIRDTLAIDFFPIPTINYTLDIDSQCLFGNTFVFENFSAISGGTFDTRIGVEGLDTFYFGNMLSVHVPTHGLHHIDIFINSDLQCKDTVAAEIRVWEMPEADFAVSSSVGCEGLTTFAFTNQTAEKPTSLDYIWRYDKLSNTDSVQQFSHVFPHEGLYDIELEAITKQNCRDTARKQLIVNPVPNPIVSTNTYKQCFNNQVYNFYSTTSLTQGKYESFWTIPEYGILSFDSLSNLRFSTIGQKEIRYKAVSDSGCSDSVAFMVEVYPSPQAAFVLDTNVSCLQYNVFNAQNISSLQVGTLSQKWYKDNFELISTAQHLTYSFSDSGWYWVRLEALSDMACADTVSTQVRVFREPVSQFSALLIDSCFYEHELAVNSQAFGFSGNLITDYYISDNTQYLNTAQFSKVFDNFGTFVIRQIVTDEHFCADTSLQQVIVYPNPIADFALNDTLWCKNNQAITFTSTSQAQIGGLHSWEWDFGDGETATDSFVNKKSYGIAGMYLIRHVILGENGCTDTIYKPIRIVDNPIAKFDADTFGACLKGNNFTLNNISTFAQKARQNYWLIPSETLLDSGASFTFSSVGQSGKVEFMLISKDELNCADTVSGFVTVYPQVNVDFISDTVCLLKENTLHSLSSISSGFINQYQWILGDGTTAEGASITHQYQNVGLYTVTLITISDFGCRDTLVKTNTAMVRSLPIVDFEYEKVFDSLKITGFLFTNKSIGSPPLFYNWTSDGVGFSNEKDPYKEFVDTGKVYVNLEVTDKYGCQNINEKVLQIILNNNIFVPNAFSPDGDGLNDIFKPEGMPYSLKYRMEIYNRWGELLFVSEDINVGWDGTYMGKDLYQDIFLYKISLVDMHNNFVSKKGMVTLIR